MNKEINYKGTNLEDIYKLALIGADYVTEKNENGVTVVNSLQKHLYKKTVLVSRLLDVVEVPEDRVMSIEQFNTYNFTFDSFKGNGIERLKADYELFENMLEDEIANIVACNNDVMSRLNELISVEVTPEKLEELKRQQDELLAQLNKTNE